LCIYKKSRWLLSKHDQSAQNKASRESTQDQKKQYESSADLDVGNRRGVIIVQDIVFPLRVCVCVKRNSIRDGFHAYVRNLDTLIKDLPILTLAAAAAER
jgi:hypothetical protein